MAASDQAETDQGERADDAPKDNVHDFSPRRPPRAGSRRVTTGERTRSDESGMLNAHARFMEVEGASDRLGLGALSETLQTSEAARRLAVNCSWTMQKPGNSTMSRPVCFITHLPR